MSQKSEAQLRVALYAESWEDMAAGAVSEGSCLGTMFSGTLNGWEAGGIQGGTAWLRSLTSLHAPRHQAKWKECLCPHATIRLCFTSQFLQRGFIWIFLKLTFKNLYVVLDINTLFLFLWCLSTFRCSLDYSLHSETIIGTSLPGVILEKFCFMCTIKNVYE